MKNKIVSIILIIIVLLSIMFAEYRYIMHHICPYKGENNTIYIAQGGFHMIIGDDKRIKLNSEPPIWGVRPAVDKLFESAVKVYKGKLISAILTGMGRDGAQGTVIVKEAGGTTISQNKETCTIYGMPKAAFNNGGSMEVLKHYLIPGRILELLKYKNN